MKATLTLPFLFLLLFRMEVTSGKNLLLTYCILVDPSTVNVGQVHLSFKGCQVYFVTFILFFDGWKNPVSKHCRP